MEAGGGGCDIFYFSPHLHLAARNESSEIHPLNPVSQAINVFPQSPKTDLNLYKNVPSPRLYNICRFPSQITAFCRSFLYVFTHLLLLTFLLIRRFVLAKSGLVVY